MYDQYARQLIAAIPDLPDIDRDACRRALSAAFFYVVRSRLSIQRDDFSRVDLGQIRLILRGLGDALESVAVFDKLNNVERTSEEEEASAFVAAEALAMLCALPSDSEQSIVEDVLQNELHYVSIESALLYMIGGYDINAASAVRSIEVPMPALKDVDEPRYARLMNAAYVLDRTIALCCGRVRRSGQGVALVRLAHQAYWPANYEALSEEIRARLYELVGNALDAYLDWLGGYRSGGYTEAATTLRSARGLLTEGDRPEYGAAYADIYHFSSLLLAAIERTKGRALIYNVPKPIDGDAEVIESYGEYLRLRARGGERHRGRPFLWPSTLEYIQTCLPGPSRDAVIAMPTGSGKSFIAELAATHALCEGWVLYLAPTNALAHQIGRDLKRALGEFPKLDVRAFVGAEEYTTLSEEQIGSEPRHFVAVMTPEKCALAIRLYPERFAECTLCVFDECHLLNDEQRRVTADILLAQLSLTSPRIRFLLMSAMLSNSDELAEWLSSAHGTTPYAPPLKWRPSRTLRGLLLLDQESLDTNYEQAELALSQLPERRVNYNFDVSLALIAGLSGPWTEDGSIDYRVTRLPLSFTAYASRKPGKSGSPQFDSWKNTAARFQSELLAKSEVPVLCFILSSRHHAFSGAEKVTVEIPGALGEENELPPLVKAWLSIADAELGVETVLRQLLVRGITVHTSAMLQPEQAASEWMFREQKALLMFASPTLAQGLNLPALGVVIAGTSMGDPREADRIDGVSRVNALILNGFGRAGRPGVSNQGLAILVSDSPFSAEIVPQLDPALALNQYGVLGEEDAAVEARSPVEAFLDHILGEDDEISEATPTELTLTALLAEYDSDDHKASQILTRTLAAYQNRHRLSPDLFGRAHERISEMKADFLQQPAVPDWINHAAMKAGVSFVQAWHMWMAYQQYGLITTEEGQSFTVIDWFDVFFEVVALLPPCEVTRYFADDDIKSVSVLTRLRDSARGREEVDAIPWEAPEDWPELWRALKELVLMYMRGDPFTDIARSFKGLPEDSQITNKRTAGSHPIPAVFGFLRKVVDPLAIDAGCFLAIQELSAYDEGLEPPGALRSLPLCIRNGCDSLGVLSWYRFGYRERVCAHAFQAVFPVPVDLSDDSSRAEWVRNTREDWLLGRLATDGYPVLDHAMTVIKEGESL